MESIKKDIRLLSLAEIKELFVNKGEATYRANQVFDWLWKKHAISFEQMSNISLGSKNFLNETFDIKAISVQLTQKSIDKTVKTVFRLFDNYLIEGVLIPSENRATACISSQVGCALACKFCATGKLGWERNLEYPEIFDQVMFINKQSIETLGMPLSNIVLMGMGEPLLNYNHVLKAIEMITSPNILNFSPYRITLSTVGIVKMIKQLADDDVKFNLAISLHAATDKKRSLIMPINEQNSLSKLIDALQYFYNKTKTRITLEYLILEGFNDSIEDARDLALLCKNFPCKINIIEYNAIDDGIYKNSSVEKVNAFMAFIERKNIIINLRKSKGKDIAAACGQLARKNNV